MKSFGCVCGCFFLFALCTSSLFAELPDRFVEYVESTDNATYVKTGINANPRMTRMVVTFAPMEKSGGKGVFGSRCSDSRSEHCYVLSESVGSGVRLNLQNWLGQYGSAWPSDLSTGAARTPAVAIGTVHTIDILSSGKVAADLQAPRALFDDTLVAAVDGDSRKDSEGAELYLFTYNNTTASSVPDGLKQRVYGARIYVDGATLSANLIPCVKDDVAGLYDTVSGTIRYSETTPLLAAESDHPDVRLNNDALESRLSVTTAAGGTVQASGESWVVVGSTVTLSATPDAGKQTQWSSTHAGEAWPVVDSGDTLAFAMPPFPVAVAATFSDAAFAPFVSNLQPAIDATPDGGTLLLGEGVYTLTNQMTVSRAITIKGAGRGRTVITGAAGCYQRALEMTADATVRDLTFTGFTNEWEGATVRMTKGTLDTVEVSFGCNPRNNLRNGVGVWMSGGMVTNSFVASNTVSIKYGGVFGIGVCAKGTGLIVDSVIKDNFRDRGEHKGAGVYLDSANAKLLRCRIEGNNSNGKGSGSSNTLGLGVYVGNGLVDRCTIVSNGIQGVCLDNGTLRNSLVHGHASTALTQPSGVWMKNCASMYHCTISDNTMANDTCYPGLLGEGSGEIVNCIIYGNGAFGNAKVTSNPFYTNIVDSASSIASAMQDGVITMDARFKDPDNKDFRITAFSPARDKAAVVADCETDLNGVARDATPDIGCYEFVSDGSDELACAIIVTQGTILKGDDAVAEATVEGASGTLRYRWFVDGIETAQTGATAAFSGLDYGRHTLRLVVSDGAATAEAVEEDVFDVRARVAYAAPDGGNVYPYETPAKAARSANDAFDALYKSEETAVLHLAAGDYILTTGLDCLTPVEIRGAGRDLTVLNGAALGAVARAVTLAASGALLRDVTVTGCTNNLNGAAVQMTAEALVENVRIHFNEILGPGSPNHPSSGILNISAGTVTNAVIDGNSVVTSYGSASGIGVFLSGGLVVDCEITDNWIDRGECIGGGVRMSGGTLRRCLVRGNNNRGCIYSGTRSDNNGLGKVLGLGVVVEGSGALVEDCTIVANGIQGVYLLSGTVRNSLVTGHVYPEESDSAGGVVQVGGNLLNCTVAGNMSSDSARNDLLMRGGTARNTIARFAVVENGTESHNVFNIDPLFKNAEAGDYTLQRNSPAANAGDNGVWADVEDPRDFAGNPRIAQRTVDCGCYELSGAPLMVIIR